MEARSTPVVAQSAVIPYRIRPVTGRLEVCLITNRTGRRWVVPKGSLEPDLSEPYSAAREALEEAGLEGVLHHLPLGVFEYRKRGLVFSVRVFPLRVHRIHRTWQEAFRLRRWMSLEQAIEQVGHAGLRPLLEALPRALGLPSPRSPRATVPGSSPDAGGR